MTLLHLSIIGLLILVTFTVGDEIEVKRQQAQIRARLAKAKSIREVLIILKTAPVNNGPERSLSPETIKKEVEMIMAKPITRTRNMDSYSTTVPRNGGCEPRVVCEEVPIDRSSSNNIMSYPVCLEVHRCGGCCQEAQFPCVPVEEEKVTFSPLLTINLDNLDNYEVNRQLILMNHTRCECKCTKTNDQCRREGKTLDATLCQCVKPACSPVCSSSSTCSLVIVNLSEIPRCTCRRRIPGQTSNFCSNSNQQPNQMCTACETVNG